MNIIKKSAISTLLCLILLAALIPHAAFAAPDEDFKTVTFKVNNKVYKTQSVLNETLVSKPADPLNPSGKEPFLGWYVTVEDESVPYNFKEIVTEDLELTAKFSNDFYILIFEDGEGVALNVAEIGKEEVVPEDAIPVLMNLSIDKGIKYWYSDNENTPVDLSLPIQSNTNVMTLYPKIESRNVALFITNGTTVIPQSGFDEFYAEEPDPEPERLGYDFDYWSWGADYGNASFDFDNEPISGTVNIYAEWTPATVDYTVNFWNEKENIADPGDPRSSENLTNYELVYTDTTKQATAGTKVSFTATEANALYLAAGNSLVNNVLNYSSMVYSEEKEIAGSGETVINVYYTRKVYNFTFDINKNNQTSPVIKNVTAIFGDPAVYEMYSADQNKANLGTLPDGVTIISPGIFKIQVKLGQDVSDIWPYDVVIKNADGTVNTDMRSSSWSGYYGVSQTKISSGGINAYINGNYNNGSRNEANYDTKNLMLIWNTSANMKYTEERHYYLEVLPGEENTQTDRLFTIPGTSTASYYRLSQQSRVTNQTSDPKSYYGGWPGREIEGFLTITNSSVYNGKTIAPQKNYQKISTEDNLHYVIEYDMPRLSYNATLMLGSGMEPQEIQKIEDLGFTVSGSTADKNVLYDQELTLPGQMETIDGYTFAGWYFDEEFKEEFTDNDADEGNISMKMPAHQVTLYAKYVGDTYNVTYYDGNAVVKENGYVNGKHVTEHNLTDSEGNIDYASLKKGDEISGKGKFLGWYYPVKVGPQTYMTEFPLDIVVAGDIDIYAMWEPETYTLSYYYVNPEDDSYQTAPDATETVTSSRNTLARNGRALPTQSAAGYSFAGWYTEENGEGMPFTSATKITGDLSVYSVMELNGNSSGSSGSSPYGKAEVMGGERSELDPDEDVPGFTTPENGFETQSNWAAANAVAVGAGLLIAAAVVIGLAKQRKDVKYDTFFVLKALAVLTALVSTGVFLWADDLRSVMVMTNEWTVYLALLLAVEIILIGISFLKKGAESKEMPAN